MAPHLNAIGNVLIGAPKWVYDRVYDRVYDCPSSRVVSYAKPMCGSAQTGKRRFGTFVRISISRTRAPSGSDPSVKDHSSATTLRARDPLTVDVPREFHRRMAAIIDTVQTAIWQKGVHDLLGYATDYAFGQQRGLQTLVLKSKHRSAYVRLHWETVMSDMVQDRELVDEVVRRAISELC